MALWVTRAGRYGERIDLALDNNLVAIGWEELSDLSKVTSKVDLRKMMEEVYAAEKHGTVSNWINQVWAFIHEMKEKDLILMPDKKTRLVHVGEVKSIYQYRAEFPNNSRHTRQVHWLKDFSRSQFDQELLYSLGGLQTVYRIQKHDAENRIRKMLSQPEVVMEAAQKPEEGESLDLEELARDQIEQFIIQRYKGHKLAFLVGDLLKVQGYQVCVSPEGPDGGVDILASAGPMGFSAPHLAVQVKSGSSPVDVSVFRELLGTMDRFGADYGLLVSWGGFKSTVEKEATNKFFKVRLWNSSDLVDALLRHYHELPDDVQAELPLKRIWILTPEVTEE
jgi:restriction system protein